MSCNGACRSMTGHLLTLEAVDGSSHSVRSATTHRMPGGHCPSARRVRFKLADGALQGFLYTVDPESGAAVLLTAAIVEPPAAQSVRLASPCLPACLPSSHPASRPAERSQRSRRCLDLFMDQSDPPTSSQEYDCK
jgi:hypothetical protein